MTTQIEMQLSSESWCHESTARILAHYHSGQEFNADDLYTFLPPAPHRNAHGNLVHAMAKRGLIEHVRYQKSKRAERNGGLVGVWRVK